MTFNFESEVDIKFDFDYIKLYEAVCIAALDEQDCPYEASVELLLTNDEAIQVINNDTRNIDKATDVLSFPMNEFVTPGDFACLEDEPDSFDPETGELILGDIVLSIDHILAQAYEYGHSVEREYAFLIAHSMLHLMGYDHMEDDERAVMESHQQQIMENLYNDFPALKVEK